MKLSKTFVQLNMLESFASMQCEIGELKMELLRIQYMLLYQLDLCYHTYWYDQVVRGRYQKNYH